MIACEAHVCYASIISTIQPLMRNCTFPKSFIPSQRLSDIKKDHLFKLVITSLNVMNYKIGHQYTHILRAFYERSLYFM